MRRFTKLDVRDYDQLLHFQGKYGKSELELEKDDWLVNKKLSESKLRDEGINVLGLTRTDESYIGIPTGDTEFEEGDLLILYGYAETLEKLDERKKGSIGDYEHEKRAEKYVTEKKEEEKTKG